MHFNDIINGVCKTDNNNKFLPEPKALTCLEQSVFLCKYMYVNTIMIAVHASGKIFANAFHFAVRFRTAVVFGALAVFTSSRSDISESDERVKRRVGTAVDATATLRLFGTTVSGSETGAVVGLSMDETDGMSVAITTSLRFAAAMPLFVDLTAAARTTLSSDTVSLASAKSTSVSKEIDGIIDFTTIFVGTKTDFGVVLSWIAASTSETDATRVCFFADLGRSMLGKISDLSILVRMVVALSITEI